jgi:hypothetical protein
MFREISAARAMLNQYGGIPLGKIKGFRAPFCKFLIFIKMSLNDFFFFSEFPENLIIIIYL